MAKDLEGSPPDIHAAVFDLDGLLVNTEELYQDVGSELLRRRPSTRISVFDRCSLYDVS